MTPDELREAIAFQKKLIKALRNTLEMSFNASPDLNAEKISHLTSALNNAIVSLSHLQDMEKKVSTTETLSYEGIGTIVTLAKAQDLKRGMVMVFTEREPLTIKAIIPSEELPPTYEVYFDDTEATCTLDHDRQVCVVKK